MVMGIISTITAARSFEFRYFSQLTDNLFLLETSSTTPVKSFINRLKIPTLPHPTTHLTQPSKFSSPGSCYPYPFTSAVYVCVWLGGRFLEEEVKTGGFMVIQVYFRCSVLSISSA